MVTHDLDSLFTACDRIAVLADKRVLVEGTFAEMLKFDHPWVRTLLSRPAGPRLERMRPRWKRAPATP